jgi:hypothetical protein
MSPSAGQRHLDLLLNGLALLADGALLLLCLGQVVLARL